MKQTIQICIALAILTPFAAADTLYDEDFSSGDSSLDTWTHIWGTNSVDASSGDLVLTGNNAFVITGEPAVDNLDGTSIRAEFVFGGPNSSGIGLLTNGDASVPTAYQGGYNPSNDRLYVGWNSPTMYNGFVAEDAGFNLQSGEGLVLQFDVFDNKLELWAWEPGGNMPAEPQISFVDESIDLAPGSPGLLFDAQGTNSSTTYRYIRVDNVPIPEPSSSLLALVGFLSIGIIRRHRSQ